MRCELAGGHVIDDASALNITARGPAAEGRFAPSGSFDLNQLPPVIRVEESASLAELARAQQVTPWPAIPEHASSRFGTSDLSDEDFSAFMSGALSARGNAE